MNDLISRQAAIDAVTTMIWHYPNELYKGLNQYEAARGLAEMALLSLPSAQPERNLCRNCKWVQYYGEVDKYGNVESSWYCRNWFGGTDEEGFCHEWERRENG